MLLIDRQLAISLGPSDYGEFKYIIVIVFTLSVVSSLGLSSSVVRFISTNENKHKYIARVVQLSFALVFSACFVVSGLMLIPLVHKWFGVTNHNLLFILLGSVFFVSANGLCQGIFSGLKLSVPKTIINDVFGPGLYCLVVYVHFALQLSIELLACLYLVYMAAVTSVNLVYLVRYKNTSLGNNADLKSVNDLFQYTWPLYLTSISIAVTASVDKFILGLVVSKYDLGIYFVGVTLSSVISLVLNALLFIYFPCASRNFSRGNYHLMEFVSAFTSKWAAIAAFIPFWILFEYTEKIIRLLFSEDYLVAIDVLRILAVAQYFNVAVGFTGQNILAIGDSLIQMKIRILGLIFGIVVGFYMAILYGIEGISVSVLLTLIVTNFSQILVLRIKYRFHAFKRTNYRFIIYILVFMVFDNYLDQVLILENMIHSVSVEAALFCFGLILFGLFNTADLRVMTIVGR